jgi:hypothetical protein
MDGAKETRSISAERKAQVSLSKRYSQNSRMSVSCYLKPHDYKIWAEAAFVLSQKVKVKNTFLDWWGVIHIGRLRGLLIFRCRKRKVSKILQSNFTRWRKYLFVTRTASRLGFKCAELSVKRQQRRIFDFWIRYIIRRRHREFTSSTAVARWMRAMKAGVFKNWRWKLEKLNRLRRIVTVCSQRFVRNYFVEWCVSAYRGSRNNLMDTRLRSCLAKKSKALRNWNSAHKISQNQSRTHHLLLRLLTKGSTFRWFDYCFRAWKEQVSEYTHQHEMLLSMRTCSVMSAISNWRVNAERQRWAKACRRISEDEVQRVQFLRAYASNKIIARQNIKTLFRIFYCWSKHVMSSNQMLDAGKSLADLREHEARDRAWGQWRTRVSYPKLFAAFDHVVSSKTILKRIAPAFREWKEQYLNRLAAALVGRAAQHKPALRLRLACFTAWLSARRATTSKLWARTRCRRRLLRRAAALWRRAGAAGAHAREAAAALCRERGQARVRAAWEWWASRAGERCRLQQALQIFHLKTALRV